MKITISGMPGSGKTTIGQLLAKELSLEFISVGNLRGKMAIEKGLTLEELNVLGEKEAWTDRQFDEYQENFGKTHDNFIMEGRLSYYFIPDSIKIFLDVNLRVGAERIWNNPRPDEEKRASIEEEMRAISERIASDKKRYQKYYHIDPYDSKNFDFVINTTMLSQNETLTTLLQKIRQKIS